MLNNDNLDEIKLNQLRIHELRDLARNIGVQSPTSKNKDELIEKVLKILNGEVAPFVRQSAKGRPNRSANKLGGMDLMPENLNLEGLDFNVVLENKTFDFYTNMPAYEFNANGSSETIVKGYLDVTTSGYGIIRVNGFSVSDNDVYVHKMHIAKNNLVSGDYVVAKAKLIYANKPMVVTQIEVVNNGALRVEKFDNLEKHTTNQTFNLLNKNIGYGTSTLVLSSSNVMFSEAKRLAQSINPISKIVVVAPSKNCEDLVDDVNNQTLIPFDVTKSYLNVYSNLKQALLKAKNLATQNNNVVLVISGINYYFRALSALISDGEKNVVKLEEMVKMELTKILLSAKATKNASLSVVLFETEILEQKLLDFVKFDIAKLMDNNLKI